VKSLNTKKWRRVPIVELCEAHVDCVNRTAPVVDSPTPYKMIRTTNVRDGFIDTENVRCVTEETYKKWTRRLIPKRGDVILTREAPLGKVGKIRSDDQIFLGQRLYHFRTNPQKLDADFLLYALLYDDLQGQIRGYGSGATVEHMRLEDVPCLEILLPEIEEQRKIAAILSAYDDLIENNLRRIKILEEMAQNLYREWFVKFRFPGHEQARFVDSPLGRIPEGWEVTSVEKTFIILGGGTPSKAIPEYWNDGSVKWYTPTDLTASSSMFMKESGKKISALGLKMSSARLFPSFSVMMTSRATLGVISINTTEACTNQGFITCIPNERFPLYTLFFWLKENVEYFISLGTGATFKEITKGIFKTIELIVPEQLIISQFEELVQPLTLQILNLQRKSKSLRRTRDMLLPRLISGEVDVSELDITIPEEAVA
jgi:type I restriction enzyme S subunit